MLFVPAIFIGVIPAQAGIQRALASAKSLDSRLRGNDHNGWA
jgi:hypothetical protein